MCMPVHCFDLLHGSDILNNNATAGSCSCIWFITASLVCAPSPSLHLLKVNGIREEQQSRRSISVLCVCQCAVLFVRSHTLLMAPVSHLSPNQQRREREREGRGRGVGLWRQRGE